MRAAFLERSARLRALLPREHLAAGELEAAGLIEVAVEHDARVRSDPALSGLERRVYLGDWEAVREVAAAAQEPAA